MSELSPTIKMMDDYPPPASGAPPSSSSSVGRRGRSPGRERSISPRRRSPSGGRYYDERRSYRDDDRYQRDRYDYPRRDYYQRDYDHRDRYDRYDHRYDHRDRYERYDDRRGGGRYPPKSRQRRPVDRGSEQERKTSTTIYAGNLPYDFVERDVLTMFERYGNLKSVTVPMDTVTNKNKGFAFVEFDQRHDAEDAFNKFDGFSVEGRRLRLDWDIGLSKKEQHRPRRSQNGSPSLDDRDRGMGDPYAVPPPPPPMESRGYRRDSPEPYRR
ncbi:hypothetical protein G6F56_002016 [Rhizopus delemar]|nr:hypothetical protein G6F56_002016 [Rhizopus delemar]